MIYSQCFKRGRILEFTPHVKPVFQRRYFKKSIKKTSFWKWGQDAGQIFDFALLHYSFTHSGPVFCWKHLWLNLASVFYQHLMFDLGIRVTKTYLVQNKLQHTLLRLTFCIILYYQEHYVKMDLGWIWTMLKKLIKVIFLYDLLNRMRKIFWTDIALHCNASYRWISYLNEYLLQAPQNARQVSKVFVILKVRLNFESTLLCKNL